MSCTLVEVRLSGFSTAELIAEAQRRPDWSGLLAQLIEAHRQSKKREPARLAHQKPQRFGGQVRLWNDERKFGILETALGDAFVHVSDLRDGMRRLERGQLLSFVPIVDAKGTRATHVKRAEP